MNVYMATYKGTAQDDVINGSTVAGADDWIDALEGNDRVTLGERQIFVSNAGDDTVTGSNGRGGYGLWYVTAKAHVDLAQGYALDGMGGRDTLSGIDTVHMTALGGTVIGSASAETVFLFGGSNNIDLDAGQDVVRYHEKSSGDYAITSANGTIEVRHKASGAVDTLKGVERIEFADKSFSASFLAASIRAELQYVAHSFVETTRVPAYTYAGVEYPAGLLSWFPQAVFQLDLSGDGRQDVILPMNKGYASGADTRTPFIALTVSNGKLVFDAAINAAMPVTAGARRADAIELADGHSAVVTIAHDTHDGKLADLQLLREGPGQLEVSNLVPALPLALPGRPHAVNAHSMATGDLNGDGRTDILVGDWNGTGAFALLQGAGGGFTLDRQPAYAAMTYNWPLVNPNAGEKQNLLVDLDVVDVNGDGFGDIIAGYGHGSTQSQVFINTSGSFDAARRIALPASAYGIDNQMHMKTLSADFDRDGDIDLAVLQSRYVPYYGGNYLQILSNDGRGNFTDVTAANVDKPFFDRDGARLEWTDYWQLADVNGDGAIDILGHRSVGSTAPLVYVNDGKGRFSVVEIATSSGQGRPLSWGDFDGDGKLEYVDFGSTWRDAAGSSSLNSFSVFELSSAFGTGPGMAAPPPAAAAFNEAFYLNENADVRAMVASGQYADGLAHFLARGQAEGRPGIAAGVTVQGGAQADNIVLREGNETARGGLGNDRIEGRAGNDLIEGGEGDDALDGGAGFDLALYAGSRAGYVIARDGAGFKVTDRSGKEGSDALTGVERLQFADGMVALDVDGVAGQAYRIYQAAFARQPDKAGLGYWIGMMDKGMSLATVAAGFAGSAEFAGLYGANPSSREIIGKFYLNVLNRPGEAAGIDYWANVLDQKLATVAEVLMGFSESAENQAALVGVTAQGIAYDPFA